MTQLGEFRKFPRRASIALLGAAVVAAGSTTETAATTTPRPITISWSRCKEARALQCGRLSVPLDTTNPGKETISLALVRAKARIPKQRLGVLFVNPGGPGGSAVDFAQQIADSDLIANIRDRYDIVGWDPRGVARSSPVRCLANDDYTRFYGADPTPDNPAETAELIAVSKLFVAGCVKRNGVLLQHVSTADTVADMERIRVALGEDKVSLLGFSYGTYLGSRYADRYPNRVGRFVLDGVLDPAVGADDRVRLQAAGFERDLTDFLKTCGRSTCTFPQSGETPVVAFDRLMARFETTPMEVRTSTGRAPLGKSVFRKIGPGEAMTGVLAALYNVEAGWPRLRDALNAVGRGDGRGLLALFDLYADRDSNGVYGNVSDSNAAVNCSDLPSDHEFADYERLAKELDSKFPHFGAFAAYSALLCAYWPTGGRPPKAVRAVGAPPILLVGTTRDPATPYVWATAVQKELGNAALLTYDGDGHTAFLTGNRCVGKVVEAYLLAGTLPAPGTVCDA